ncbi:MAG TPA: DUF4911 domain-containing protein [Polyangiaceae bacterium]|nr:DUF4911 domain-containing protein [Polyangiaceae bacterium]
MPAKPLLDAALATRRILVQAKDVVYVKGILEGYGGLAVVFAEQGGELTLATPHSRAAELDAFIADLSGEIPSMRCL